MKWKVPANPIKGHRKLTRHNQETRQRQQRTQNVVSSLSVAPTVTIPFKFGLGWTQGGLYEEASTLKHVHDIELLGSINDGDVDLRTTIFIDNQGVNVAFPDVYNQGQLGSCTANALAFCYQFDMLKQVITFGLNKSSIPSRLFIYYYERASENTINFDAGANLSDGVTNVLAIKGVCSETDWPYYDTTNGNETYKKQPSPEAIANASFHKALRETLMSNEYDRFKPLKPIAKSIANLKNNLKLGFPIAFGFTVYQSFYNISEGNPTMPIPSPSQGDKSLGGHAVVLVGFKDNEQVFIVRNSWGNDWGDNGYFYMPYEIIDKYTTSDFWSIIEVS